MKCFRELHRQIRLLALIGLVLISNACKSGNLDVKGGVSPGATTVVSTGAGNSLGFAGLASIDMITNTSARLNWVAVAGASAYLIYNTTGGGSTYVTTITAPASNYSLTGLTSSTAYTYRVVSADQNGATDNNTVNQSFSTLGCAALSISPTTKSMFKSTTFTFTSSGGCAPVTFSVFSGGGSVGPVTGLYTAPGASGSATVRASDSGGHTADAAVTILNPVTLTPINRGVLSSGSILFSAAGGAGPYTYSVTSGTGTFVGATYTAPSGFSTETIQATDSLGNTGATSVFVIGSPRLWLKADAIVGKLNGDSLAQWSDSSGLNNHATQATAVNQPTYQTNVLNSLPIVRFSAAGPQYFGFPNIMSGAVSGEIFTALKGNAYPPTISSYTGIWYFGGSGLNSVYTWTDAKIYDDFGSGSRYGPIDPLTSIAAWKTYNITSTAITYTSRLNGSQIFNSGSNSVSFTPSPTLGTGLAIGSYNFDGDMAEVILYGPSLTAGQRSIVENYLNTKYAIY